ncbi:MAG TPA: hypothetical protein VNY32_03460, partial [Candidatus Acidoferrales bacterium]|nr:hypothetical protein [Candidatus Acidoferrales bacterium]
MRSRELDPVQNTARFLTVSNVMSVWRAAHTRQQPTPPQRDQKAARRRRNQRNAGKTPTPQSPGPLFYAIVALLAFLLGFMILGVMLWKEVLQLCSYPVVGCRMLLLASSVCGLFKWRQFEPEVILMAVGWYLRFSLSYRDVEELFAERGLSVDHVTVWRWVQRYAPELDRRLRKRL